MKQLSERALAFLAKQERRKEYHIERQDLEKHLLSYPVKDFSEILRFQETYSGIVLEDSAFTVFTRKQVREHKGVSIFKSKELVLFSISDSLYLSENGEVALRDCGCDSYDFFFYYESFETFIEHLTFFETYQYYKMFPELAYDVQCDIESIAEYFSEYELIEECSDKYHYFWKNNLNLVQAIRYPENWVILFDSISEKERHQLIDHLKLKKLIL